MIQKYDNEIGNLWNRKKVLTDGLDPDFVSWFFFQKFPSFFEAKIYINRVILTPCTSH